MYKFFTLYIIELLLIIIFVKMNKSLIFQKSSRYAHITHFTLFFSHLEIYD